MPAWQHGDAPEHELQWYPRHAWRHESGNSWKPLPGPNTCGGISEEWDGIEQATLMVAERILRAQGVHGWPLVEAQSGDGFNAFLARHGSLGGEIGRAWTPERMVRERPYIRPGQRWSAMAAVQQVEYEAEQRRKQQERERRAQLEWEREEKRRAKLKAELQTTDDELTRRQAETEQLTTMEINERLRKIAEERWQKEQAESAVKEAAKAAEGRQPREWWTAKSTRFAAMNYESVKIDRGGNLDIGGGHRIKFDAGSTYMVPSEVAERLRCNSDERIERERQAAKERQRIAELERRQRETADIHARQTMMEQQARAWWEAKSAHYKQQPFSMTTVRKAGWLELYGERVHFEVGVLYCLPIEIVMTLRSGGG